MKTSRMLAAASAALLLAAPAVATAKKPEDKGGKGKGPKTVSFVLKGTYQGDSTVLVAKGNGAAKKAGLVGQTVTLDLTGAKLKVDDVNADGARTVDDVQLGDKVVVKAKAPRGTTAADTLVARQLVDQTHKDADGDDADDDAAPVVETETEE